MDAATSFSLTPHLSSGALQPSSERIGPGQSGTGNALLSDTRAVAALEISAPVTLSEASTSKSDAQAASEQTESEQTLRIPRFLHNRLAGSRSDDALQGLTRQAFQNLSEDNLDTSKSASELRLANGRKAYSLGIDNAQPLSETTLDFSVKTESGKQITVSLSYSEFLDGVSARVRQIDMTFASSDPLSDEEAAALGELGDWLENLSGDFLKHGYATPDDFSALTDGPFSELSVDFQSSSDQFSLTLNRREDTWDLKSAWNDNRVDISLDHQTLPGMGTSVADSAMESLIKNLTDAGRKSRSNESFLKLSQSLFEAAFTLTPAKGSADAGGPWTGLPDFTASFRSARTQPNPESEKFYEREGWSLDMAQQSGLRELGNGWRAASQTLTSELEASWYEPLNHLEDPDWDTQSYRYRNLTENSTRTTHQITHRDQTVATVQMLDTAGTHRTREYSLDELIADETRRQSESEFRILEDLAETPDV